MTVRYSSTSSTPVAGSTFNGTSIGLSTYLSNPNWSQKTITLQASTFSEQTIRLVFSWRNDSNNLDGVLISKQNFGGGVYNVSLGHLPKGLYIVKTSFGSEKKVLKVLMR